MCREKKKVCREKRKCAVRKKVCREKKKVCREKKKVCREEQSEVALKQSELAVKQSRLAVKQSEFAMKKRVCGDPCGPPYVPDFFGSKNPLILRISTFINGIHVSVLPFLMMYYIDCIYSSSKLCFFYFT